MFNGGMNAYNKHGLPSKEMLDIWVLKEKLIAKILNKRKDLTKQDLEFQTPEQLQLILDNKHN